MKARADVAKHRVEGDRMEEWLGAIKTFGGTYAPPGYALCDGQLLQIEDYPALYSIIGSSYGGDGLETFALPELSPDHRREWPEGSPVQVMCIEGGVYPPKN